MKNRLLDILSIVLVLFTISLIGLIVVSFSGLGLYEEDSIFSEDKRPLYHVMIIVDSTNESFSKQIEMGATAAASETSSVFEFWSFEGANVTEDIIKQFDIGIESEVDGIIVQTVDDPKFHELLNKASGKNIPVVLLSEDVVDRPKTSVISFNEYQIGSRLGYLINNQSDVEEGTFVVINNSSSSIEDRAIAINDRLPENIHVVVEDNDYNTKKELNTDQFTRNLISKYDDLIGIVCTNATETLGVIQVLKDNNMLNDVMVVGASEDEEILNYVKRKVIFATVRIDGYSVGYDSFYTIVQEGEGEFVSQYDNIKVTIISESNYDVYYLEAGDIDE